MNSYAVLIRKNGSETIKMIAKAHDINLAEDVAMAELRAEDPSATYEVVACVRTRGKSMYR